MSNMGYVKALTVTNMQIIITKIGCRIDQSSKIRCDVLICAGVSEPSRSRDISNSKMSRGLLRNWEQWGAVCPKPEHNWQRICCCPDHCPALEWRLVCWQWFGRQSAAEWPLFWGVERLLWGRQLPLERPLLRLKLGL
jgi:hypothetical protein